MRKSLVFVFFLFMVLLFVRVIWPLRQWPFGFWTLAFFFGLGLTSLLWLFLVHWWSEQEVVKWWHRSVEKTAHLTMGMASFWFLGEILREVAALFSPRMAGPIGSLSIVVSSLVLFLLGYLGAMRTPSVKVVRFRSLTPMPEGFRLRIAQLSDLHVGPWIRRPFVEKVRDRLLALGELDLFVLTGDIGDSDPLLHREHLAPLGEVETRLGRFSVTGNHEGYWSERGWNHEIERLGFRILENESFRVEKDGVTVAIAGIPDLRPDVARASANLEASHFNLFLSHQPKHAAQAAAYPIDLQLSGHTHAGQFLPWSLIIGLFHRHPQGLYREGPFSIYVSAGTGFWGPPLRIGTRSEITLIEVTS